MQTQQSDRPVWPVVSAQSGVLEWLAADSGVGTSSRTLASWLALGRIPGYPGHPYDPDDFDRCLRLLAKVPELRSALPRMADVSPEWAALVARWDEVEASHLAEVGLGWTKAKRAPLTCDLMQQVYALGASP